MADPDPQPSGSKQELGRPKIEKKTFRMSNPEDLADAIELLQNGSDSEFDLEIEEDEIEPEETPVFTPGSIRLGVQKLTPAAENWVQDTGFYHVDHQEEVLDQPDEIQDQLEEVSQYNFITKKNEIEYRRQKFVAPLTEFNPSNKYQVLDVTESDFPITFFKNYVSDDLFEQMATFTNIYALQKGTNSFKATNAKEFKFFIGLHIIMGCLKFPRAKMYWESLLGLSIFLDNMTKNRFFQLRTHLHVVNNLERPKGCTDIVWKVRPLFDAIRERALKLELEEYLSIDEQIVPFKGQLSIKQYIKGKPSPWGIKIFVLAGQSGIFYDFLIYQGKTSNLSASNVKQFGLGASVVLHLAQRIPNYGHKLFYDNYFSSYSLLQILKNKNIFAAGTVRVNRFSSPPLMKDTEMKKKERGFAEELQSRDGDVVLTKWLDGRTVVLAANLVGIGQKDEVERWDKSRKAYLKVSRPEVVKLYNYSMGGVDLLDQMISLYRISMRSRKWTLKMIMHSVDMAVVNSWNEYRAACRASKVANKDIMDLLAFRMRIGESLVCTRPKPKSRGRPSLDDKIHHKKQRTEVRPIDEVRLDGMDHLAIVCTKPDATRCKLKSCSGKSKFLCSKCKVHLCLNKDRNCFFLFHTK